MNDMIIHILAYIGGFFLAGLAIIGVWTIVEFVKYFVRGY